MDAHEIGAIDLRGGQSLSVRGDRGARRGARRGDREHRHRRPGDGPLGGEEPRLRHDRHRSGRLRRAARRTGGNDGATTLDFRKRMAAKAFAATAAYDAMISQWFAFADQGELFPDDARDDGGKLGGAALRREPAPAGRALRCPPGRTRTGLPQAEQVQGKELSYNNYNDADAALELAAEFARRRSGGGDRQARQPVRRGAGGDAARGLAARRSPAIRVSAFGGIVAANRPLDGPTAEAICEIFTEVVVAPGADEAARAVFARQEEPAPAADRRPARSAPRRPDDQADRRRAAGAGPRQRRDHRATISRWSPSARRPSRNWPTACSPGPSRATSSRTRSSMPGTASPPGSAPAR